jgi:hypothetical protein
MNLVSVVCRPAGHKKYYCFFLLPGDKYSVKLTDEQLFNFKQTFMMFDKAGHKPSLKWGRKPSWDWGHKPTWGVGVKKFNIFLEFSLKG